MADVDGYRETVTEHRALFAGSFDPPHLGHVDVLEAAAKLFDKVYWVVAYNSQKPGYFAIPERRKMMERLISYRSLNLTNVIVDDYDFLTVDAAVLWDCGWMVRSVRMVQDFDYELQMAFVNAKLNKNLQTIYIPPKQENLHISSTIVRELIRNNMTANDNTMVNLKEYVPSIVANDISNMIWPPKVQGQ